MEKGKGGGGGGGGGSKSYLASRTSWHDFSRSLKI